MGKSSKSAAAEPTQSAAIATLPEAAKPRLLPQFKVILHNDDKNDVDYVVETIMMLCSMNLQDAFARTQEADTTGCSLLLITHRERAELYVDQFQSRSLTVTMEPAE